MLCWSSRAALSLSNLTRIKTTEQITGSIIISMIMKGLYNPSEKKMLPRQDNIFFSMILFFSFAHYGCKLLRGKQTPNFMSKPEFSSAYSRKRNYRRKSTPEKGLVCIFLCLNKHLKRKECSIEKKNHNQCFKGKKKIILCFGILLYDFAMIQEKTHILAT